MLTRRFARALLLASVAAAACDDSIRNHTVVILFVGANQDDPTFQLLRCAAVRSAARVARRRLPNFAVRTLFVSHDRNRTVPGARFDAVLDAPRALDVTTVAVARYEHVRTMLDAVSLGAAYAADDMCAGFVWRVRLEKARLPRCRVVLDLDQTLIHMMRGSEMPATASEIAEALVYVGPHAIAVRPGAGALIDGLLATGVVDVSVTTLNLEGAEAVRAVGRSTAPYARSWAGLDVTVVSGEERTRRGGRESKVLESGARCYEPDTTTVAPGMLCILDDQPEAWKPFLRPFVAKIEPYRVDQPIETREALAASMRYLGDLAADLLPQLRARGVVWPLPPRWTRSG